MVSTRLLASVVLVAVLVCGSAALTPQRPKLTPKAQAHQIPSMPGFSGPLPAAFYGGYINVDAAHGRDIYYMFEESQGNPATDPLVLWLTGGPGCSGLAALFAENGMFNIDFVSGNPVVNPYSWNRVANVLYIESPAGVGFSFSNTSSDYTTGDARTAADTYALLQGFLAIHPQFRQNPFWVTGESYGGHYIPEIVSLVVQKNLAGETPINIKGLMAGNPWTDPESEAFGVTDNWWQRAIISEKVHNDINQFCSYRDITHWIINNVSAAVLQGRPMPVMSREFKAAATTPSQQCFAALTEGSLVQFGDINILGVYLDVCSKGAVGNIPDQPNFCAPGQLTTYLNRMDVQVAIHIINPPVQWASCTTAVSYNQIDTQTSVLPLYRKMIADGKLKILIYSGDNDAIVPTTGTRRWLKVLNLPIVKDTTAWYADTNGPQVAGWVIQYEGLRFTTIRDGGHMVPFTQPKRAFDMFSKFLDQLPF